MDPTAIERAVDEFWQQRGRGVYFPPSWENRLDLDAAYRIQLALIARRCASGVTHVGWKVGLTAKAIQESSRSTSRSSAALLSEGRVESGRSFATTS